MELNHEKIGGPRVLALILADGERYECEVTDPPPFVIYRHRFDLTQSGGDPFFGVRWRQPLYLQPSAEGLVVYTPERPAEGMIA